MTNQDDKRRRHEGHRDANGEIFGWTQTQARAFERDRGAFAVAGEGERKCRLDLGRPTLQGRIGEFIDFANERVGDGGNFSMATTIHPIDRVTFDLAATREWLNAAGGRVYTADVERLKAIYSFSAKSILRVIGQAVTTERDPARYGFAVPPHSGSFLASVLYSYKINWQTVLFAGYGDDRVLTASDDLVKLDQSLFFKVSYAIQR